MLKKLLPILLLPFLLTACNKTDTEEISFSSWGSITEVQILDKVISDFERENHDIKVKFMHIPQNYFQKVHLLFASSTAPDVVFINNLYLPVYADRLEDLSQEVDKAEFYEEGINALSLLDALVTSRERSVKRERSKIGNKAYHDINRDDPGYNEFRWNTVRTMVDEIRNPK